MAKHVKGEPTRLNLWTLGQVFGTAKTIPNRLDRGVDGVRRCLKAGLVEVSADKTTLSLTERGVYMLAVAACESHEAGCSPCRAAHVAKNADGCDAGKALLSAVGRSVAAIGGAS